MKSQLITLSLAFGLIGVLGACKKADQTQPKEQVSQQPTGAVAANAKSVLLKAKWPVGNRYVYRMELDQHSTNRIPQMPKPIQQDTIMAMTYALSVQGESTNSGRDLEMKFLAIEMQVKTGDQLTMSFDSKEPADNEAQDPLAASLRKMVGSKVRMQVNAEGKVSSVDGLDEWRNNLALEDAGPGGQALNQQFNSGFFRMLVDFGRGFSTNAVSVGETWPFKVEFPSGATGKIKVDARITLKGWENHEQHPCAILESQGTFKGAAGDGIGPIGKMTVDGGKVSGRSWFDPELGAMIDSVSDQSIRVKGEMLGQPGGNRGPAGFTSDIRQKITVKLVELGKTSPKS